MARENLRLALQSVPRAALLAVLVLGAQVGGTRAVNAEELKIGGGATGLGAIQLLARAYAKSNPDMKITVLPSLGSSGSIKAAIVGVVHIATVSRPLREVERGPGVTEIEYARTPFVFAVSTKSKVGAITTRELADIYSGKMEQWADGTKIRLVLRPLGDSDTETINNISPEVRQAQALAHKRPGLLLGVTDHEAAEHIEKVPGAFGPSSLALIVSEKRLLRALRFNGVEPSPRTIADGSYPYYKPLFLVTGPKTPPAAKQFIEFVQSPAGREMLRQNGHWVK
jgi:phosphate transport system substrate-binding protein